LLDVDEDTGDDINQLLDVGEDTGVDLVFGWIPNGVCVGGVYVHLVIGRFVVVFVFFGILVFIP